MDSIIQKNNKECFICGYYGQLEKHHPLNKYNRTKSDKEGLTVMLCVNCHRGINGAHHDRAVDLYLKEAAQQAWMKHYNKTKEDFINEYGRNYL